MRLMGFIVYKIKNADERSKALKALSPAPAHGILSQFYLECTSDERQSGRKSQKLCQMGTWSIAYRCGISFVAWINAPVKCKKKKKDLKRVNIYFCIQFTVSPSPAPAARAMAMLCLWLGLWRRSAHTDGKVMSIWSHHCLQWSDHTQSLVSVHRCAIFSEGFYRLDQVQKWATVNHHFTELVKRTRNT